MGDKKLPIAWNRNLRQPVGSLAWLAYAPVVKRYRVTIMHEDGAERSGLYDATSEDEARTIVERNATGIEDIEITKVECID